jgi:thiosulfate reductase cytochrome b subunit
MIKSIKSISLLILLLFIGTAVQAHSPILLKDNSGNAVRDSGLNVSITETCGGCHDTNYITKHNTHAAANFSNNSGHISALPGADCFVCHTNVSESFNEDKLHDVAIEADVEMRTLARTQLVVKGESGWQWNQSAFLADGTAKKEVLDIHSPKDENCLQCHKMEPDQLSDYMPPMVSHMNSDVFSGDKLNRSSFNIENKSEHNHSWDVHAEKLVECVNCHFSDNNPSYYRETDLTRPAHLKFDSRKLSHEAYHEHPSHLLANTPDNLSVQASGSESCNNCHDKNIGHDFLEAKDQHFRSLSCESCHISETYLSAVSTIDYTVLDLKKQPLVNGTKAENHPLNNKGSLSSQKPILLLTNTSQGEIFKPYRLTTTWYWEDAASEKVINAAVMDKAFFSEGNYKAEVVATFDKDKDLVLDHDELLIDSEVKKDLIAGLLIEQGVEKPLIKTEVHPIGIHHGVIGQHDIVKNCSECHSQDSRLTGTIKLTDNAPFEAELTPGSTMISIIGGDFQSGDAGNLNFVPQIEDSGKYVFSAVRNPWVDSIGLMSFLGVLFGIFVHGGLRLRTSKKHEHPPVKMEKVYIYRIYERIWHWIQALSILLFIFTGLEIHFSGQVNWLGITSALDLHNVTAIVFIINGILGLFFFLSTGGIKQYFPPFKTIIPDILAQAKYYGYGIFNGAPHPTLKTASRRLNSLQQVTYLGLMFGLIPFQTITGVLLFTADGLPQFVNFFGGIKIIGYLHTLSAWLFVSFLVMHIYLTTTGHTITANLKAMVNGWEDLEVSQKNQQEQK